MKPAWRAVTDSAVPAHDHDTHEDRRLVEGTLRIAGQAVRAGDFHFARGGVRHTTIVAETAALLHLRTAA